MEKARKRIRICLLCVILIAVFVGGVYYFYSVSGNHDMTQGTLIAGVQSGWERLTGYGFW